MYLSQNVPNHHFITRALLQEEPYTEINRVIHPPPAATQLNHTVSQDCGYDAR